MQRHKIGLNKKSVNDSSAVDLLILKANIPFVDLFIDLI
jgi:hypothetical protein